MARSIDGFALILTGVYIVLGGGLTWLISARGALAVQATLLPIVGSVSLYGLLRALSIFVPALPLGHCMRVSVAVSLAATGAILVLEAHAVAVVAFGWLLGVYGVLGSYACLQRILVETSVHRRLAQDYASGVLPSLSMPYTFVYAECGLGVYWAHRLVSKISNELWKSHCLPSSTGLCNYRGKRRHGFLWRHRRRGMMLFVVSESLRRESHEFVQWILTNAAAYIELKEPDSDEDLLDETRGMGLDVADQLCLGPTLPVRITTSADTQGDKPEIYILQHSLVASENRTLNDLAPVLSGRLSETALPTAASDVCLPRHALDAAHALAAHGLPPIANSYLRFRLAQSGVERFLCLLDSLEALIRFSVIALFVDGHHLSPTEKSKALPVRPTLGTWVHLLTELLRDPVSDDTLATIPTYWKGHATPAQLNLVRRVDNSGLNMDTLHGQGALDWLRWFTDLRNATRGHGIVTEAGLSPVWHDLHVAFLEGVHFLRRLVVECRLRAPNQESYVDTGWQRQYPGLQERDSDEETAVSLLLVTPLLREYLTYPFIVLKRNLILVYDHAEPKCGALVYYDYRTGIRHSIPGRIADPP